MASKREQIIEATCHLLEVQGYHASGLNQIIAESGAPKGSLYYYFPDGKEELAAEAIARTGKIVSERIRRNVSTSDSEEAGKAIPAFVRSIANAVEASGFQAGGPLTAVAMETATTSERLNLACREAFGQILAAFADRLIETGYSAMRAAELATFITAAIEGGIILSRTQHSGDPLRRVADELQPLLSAMSR
jgi:TetR/AcrR family transcriptional repressor of lmrAB and yxaGH operons